MVRDLKWLLLFTISHIDPWPYNISMIVQLISIKLDLFSLANLIIISIFLSEEYSKNLSCCWKEVVITSKRKMTPPHPRPPKKSRTFFSLIFYNIISNFASVCMKTFCELLHVHMNYCEWRKLVNFISFYQIVKDEFISYINFICIPYLLLISHGLIQLHKGFWGGLYLGGLITGIKEMCSVMSNCFNNSLLTIHTEFVSVQDQFLLY